MNYIQIDINGQKAGLKFGYPQAKEFAIALAEGENLKYYFEGENITSFGVAMLFFCAYKNNCLVKGENPVLTLETFSDWLENVEESEDSSKQMIEALQVWEQAKSTKLWIEEVKKKTAEIREQIEKILPPSKSKKSTKKSKLPSTDTESGSGS
jgi:hypothetical protein